MTNTKETKPTTKKSTIKVSKPSNKKQKKDVSIPTIKRTKHGVKTESYEMLMNYIHLLRNEHGITDSEALNLPCPKCGMRYIYKSLQDIPNKSVKCKCGGNVIEYTDKPINAKK